MMPDNPRSTTDQRSLQLEQLVAGIARRFVGIAADGLNDAIQASLGEIGTFVQADRSYIFLYDHRLGTMSNTHEWCAEGIEPQIDILQDLPQDVFAWSIARLDESAIINVPRVCDMPDEAAAERDILLEQDIQSVILVRIQACGEQTLGFIGFDAVAKERPWREDDRHLLEVVGTTIAAAIEHDRMVTRIRRSDERSRAILEAIPDMMFIVDSDGLIHDFHGPDSRLLARAPTDVVGCTIQDILDDSGCRRFETALEQANSEGSSREFEYKLELAEGPADFAGRFVRQSDGRFLAIIRDITRIKQNERSLRGLTSQLTLAEEAQRRELAVTLHDGLGQDISGALYQLQGLVNAGADVAVGSLDPVREALDRSLKQAQDLTFDLSPPSLYELGLCSALRSLVHRFNAQHPQHFSCLCEERAMVKSMDVRVLLYRTTCELLVNAVKHSRATEIHLALRRPREGIELVVEDDGVGCSGEFLEPTDVEERGGFGLYSIRQRLASYGGSLRVDDGDGARFTVFIPLAACGLVADAEVAS